MVRLEHISLILLTAFLLFATQLPAQQFGRAVAIDGDQVLILKTGTGRGPAAAYVYSAGKNGWAVTAHLGAEVTGASGHGLSPSVWADGGRAFVGSGDPGEAIYALSYRRDTDGLWIPQARVAPGATPVNTGAQEPMDLPGLMRILRPPQRILAADGDLLIVATIRQDAGKVEALRFVEQSGSWVVESELVPESGDTGDGFGSAVAVADGRVFVGAPRHEDGVVYVFSSGDDGWGEQARIDGGKLGDMRWFGSALAFDGGVLYVGARNPESKRWPGWVDADPDVRLKIGERLYEVSLIPFDEPERLGRLRRAYVAKYELPETPPGEGPPIRYWQVAPRA